VAVQEAPARPGAKAPPTCPSCSAPAERGQLVCLECGARLGIRYRRPPRWRPPAAVLAAAALVAAAGLGFALRALTDGEETERSSAPATPRAEAPAEPSRAPARPDRTEPPPAKPARPGPRGPGGVRGWPAGKDGYTVVLLSTGDEASARSRARELLKVGAPAGVLRSGFYPSLSPGFWIVFSGVFDTRERAVREADRYRKRIKGAFPQFVNGSKKRAKPLQAPARPPERTSTTPGSSTAPSGGPSGGSSPP
jgi:SPOR domain